MNTSKWGPWRGAEAGTQQHISTPRPNTMSEEEAANKRMRPDIGYGLLSEDERTTHDFIVAVYVGFAPEIERYAQWDAAYELQVQIEVAVIAWLAIHSPKGTRTSLVWTDD